MAVNTENFNTKLYDLLKVRGYKPVPLNAKNQRVEASPAADVIEFTFSKDGEDYGKAWVSIDDAQNLVVYYDNEQSDSPSGMTPGLDYDDTWTGLLKQLKNWAQRRQLSFELRDADRISDDMRHREYHKMKDKLSEGYYPMGKSASYNDSVPSVKIILQHTRQIQEGEQRFRNIAKIFLENEQGERILAPTMRPGIARVYARHIAEGGVPNDERWNHIKSICEEYNKMGGFVRATRNGQFNESAQQLVNEGINHYNSLRETLSRMTGHRGYTAYFESYTPTLMETEGDEQANLNELFVQETLDPRIESVMPILSRLRKNIGEMKEVSELSEWASNIMGEATDLKTIPEEEEVEEGMIGKILGGAALIASLWGVNYELAKDSFDNSPQLQKLEQYYQRAQKEGNVEKIKEIERRIDQQKDRLLLDKGEVMGKDGRPVDPVYEAEDDDYAKFNELLKKNPKLAQKVKTLEPEQRHALMSKLKDAEEIAKQKGDDFSGHDMENYGRAFKGILGGLFGIMDEEKEEGMEENFINMVPQAVAEGLDDTQRARLDDLIDKYKDSVDPEAYYGLNDEYPDSDEVIAQIRQEFGDKIADTVEAGAGKMHFPRDNHSFDIDPLQRKMSPRVTKSGKINKQDNDYMKREIKRRIGIGEEGVAEGSLEEDEYDKMLRDLLKARPDLTKKYAKDVQKSKDIESGKTLNKLVKKNPGVLKTYSDAVKRDKKLGVAEDAHTPEAFQDVVQRAGGDVRGIYKELQERGLHKDIQTFCIWSKHQGITDIYEAMQLAKRIGLESDDENEMASEGYYAAKELLGIQEGLDANQKRAGQLGPTEKVGKNEKNLRGKLVGANESVERDELADLKRLLGK